jgi:hypothetical protein
VTLYHYTAEHHAREIMAGAGITGGAVPIPSKDGKTLAGVTPGWQWLTDDPTWRQSWATRQAITCDRTECRLVVAVPLLELHRLLRWSRVAADFGYSPELARAFAELGGGSAADAEHWRVFGGPIPADWIVRLERRP